MKQCVLSSLSLFLFSNIDTAPKGNCPSESILSLIFYIIKDKVFSAVKTLLYIWERILQLKPLNSGSHMSSVS